MEGPGLTRAWYLRRAGPWTALLGCCASAVGCWAVVQRWPGAALILLPLTLASCAAAAGFCFDDQATAVCSVTPRGATWRRTTRLGAVLAPVGLWSVLVATVPDRLVLDRWTWWLAGVALSVLAVGAAGLGARREVPRPGPGVAGAMVMLGLTPVVLGLFVEVLAPIYTFGEVSVAMVAFWAAVAALGAAMTAGALRPGLR